MALALEGELRSLTEGDSRSSVRVGPRETPRIEELLFEALDQGLAAFPALHRGSAEQQLAFRCTGVFVEGAVQLVLTPDEVSRLAALGVSVEIDLTRDLKAFTELIRRTEGPERLDQYVVRHEAPPEIIAQFAVRGAEIDLSEITDRLGVTPTSEHKPRLPFSPAGRRYLSHWYLSLPPMRGYDLTSQLDALIARVSGLEPASARLRAELGADIDFELVVADYESSIPRLKAEAGHWAAIAGFSAGFWLDVV